MGKKKRKYDKGASVGFLMALPTVLGLILLNIYPLCRTVYMSFFKSGAFGKWTFVGLDNYVTMFQSAGFWTVTKNTLLFMLLTVPVTVVLGLLIAVLLNQSINGKTAFRAIYFLPMVVAPAAVAMVWKWLFNAEYGMVIYQNMWHGIENVRMKLKTGSIWIIGLMGKPVDICV